MLTVNLTISKLCDRQLTDMFQWCFGDGELWLAPPLVPVNL